MYLNVINTTFEVDSFFTRKVKLVKTQEILYIVGFKVATLFFNAVNLDASNLNFKLTLKIC